MSSPTAAPPSARARSDHARHLVARRELVDEALARGVEQERTLAADRLGDRGSPSAPRAGTRGGVELHELEVGQRGPGLAGEDQAGADRAARVRGARPQRGRAAGCEHEPRGGDRAPSSQARRPTQRPAAVAERAARQALQHLDPLVFGDERGQLARDRAGRSRCRRRARPAARSGRPRGPSASAAPAVGVEAHAELLEVAHRAGRLLAQDPAARGAPARGRRPACPRGAARASRPPPARPRGRPAPSSSPTGRAGSG